LTENSEGIIVPLEMEGEDQEVQGEIGSKNPVQIESISIGERRSADSQKEALVLKCSGFAVSRKE
jgi:hypothetical protein